MKLVHNDEVIKFEDANSKYNRYEDHYEMYQNPIDPKVGYLEGVCTKKDTNKELKLPCVDNEGNMYIPITINGNSYYNKIDKSLIKESIKCAIKNDDEIINLIFDRYNSIRKNDISITDEIGKINIKDIGLRNSIVTILKDNNITTIEDLRGYKKSDILKIKDMNNTILINELLAALNSYKVYIERDV